MSLFKNISVFFLATTFFVFASGLFLNFHKCQTCDISEVFINLNEDEHEHTADSESECCEGLSCVAENHIESECCNDDVFYIKISEPYTYSVDKIKFEKLYEHVNPISSFISKLQINPSTVFFKTVKPPNLSGFKLLLNICMIKV